MVPIKQNYRLQFFILVFSHVFSTVKIFLIYFFAKIIVHCTSVPTFGSYSIRCIIVHMCEVHVYESFFLHFFKTVYTVLTSLYYTARLVGDVKYYTVPPFNVFLHLILI